MSNVIGVYGLPGTGKTASLRTLNPKESYLFNCDGKPVSFEPYNKQYTEKNRNYKKIFDIKDIQVVMKDIVKEAPHIKNIIVDTLNAVMLRDEFKRMKVKGFDKWINLATSIYDFIIFCNEEIKEDVNIILIFHEDNYVDATGSQLRRILTNGQKLEKVQLETLFTTLLRSAADGVDGNNEFYFETQRNNSVTRTPMGLFSEFRIPNDMQLVINKMRGVSDDVTENTSNNT